jgi:hypothetical protein
LAPTLVLKNCPLAHSSVRDLGVHRRELLPSPRFKKAPLRGRIQKPFATLCKRMSSVTLDFARSNFLLSTVKLHLKFVFDIIHEYNAIQSEILTFRLRKP